MKTYFVTFGGPTQNFHDAVERICAQASYFGIFDEIIGYTEKDLIEDSEFWEKHSEFITSNSRGYGYWIWKPYLNYKLVNKIEEGDIVVYADAGCELRPKRIERMKEYFDILKTSEKGIIGMTLTFSEKHWTKMDLFYELNCQELINDKCQIIATAFIYKKCPHSQMIMEKWYEYACNYHLLSNSPSKLENDHRFIEHRHDQSIFSLLMKKYGCEQIGYEIVIEQKVPFWANRNYSKDTRLGDDVVADL